MTTIDRSTVMGTFHSRVQAEQAVAELRKRGFQDDNIGLAGREEVIETMGIGEEHTVVDGQQELREDLVSVTIKAEERWREALDVLLARGAFDTFPSLTDEQASISNPAEVSGQEVHLEYDPIAGPQVTLEDSTAMATGSFGLQRDPALDDDDTTVSPYVNTPTSDDDSFFNR
jgi:hypothetical protein